MKRRNSEQPVFYTFNHSQHQGIRAFKNFVVSKVNKVEIEHLNTLWFFSSETLLFNTPDSYIEYVDRLKNLVSYFKNEETSIAADFDAQYSASIVVTLSDF